MLVRDFRGKPAGVARVVADRLKSDGGTLPDPGSEAVLKGADGSTGAFELALPEGLNAPARLSWDPAPSWLACALLSSVVALCW